MEIYNNKVFIFLSSLAEFYKIPVKHGWVGKLTTKIGKELNLKSSNRLSLWINREYIPPTHIANFLKLDIPESLKTFCKDCEKLPLKALQDAPGSSFGTKGIVIQGYKFQNKEIIMACIDFLWNIERIDPDILAHTQKYLETLLSCGDIVIKKVNRRHSGG